jgi:hypothetical protein
VDEAEPNERQVLEMLVDFLGWRRAARVVGWCVLVGTLGSECLCEQHDGPDRVTNWRTLRDLHRFRAHVEGDDGSGQSDVEFLMDHIGNLVARRGYEVENL